MKNNSHTSLQLSLAVPTLKYSKREHDCKEYLVKSIEALGYQNHHILRSALKYTVVFILAHIITSGILSTTLVFTCSSLSVCYFMENSQLGYLHRRQRANNAPQFYSTQRAVLSFRVDVLYRKNNKKANLTASNGLCSSCYKQ
uniref:Uncharacterized protein n=1 Tax=Glossina pallidipes TaxID=7398 RepID=A0A1A9ZNC2_GLOPL